MMESSHSARKCQGISHKPCRDCGSDISERHYVAIYCDRCAEKRQKLSSKGTVARQSRRQCKVCGCAVGKASTLCVSCRGADSGVTVAASRLVNMAVSLGFLPPASHLDCVDCGAQAQCYDHRDYNQPLQVEPVCRPCNTARGIGVKRDRPLLWWREQIFHEAPEGGSLRSGVGSL